MVKRSRQVDSSSESDIPKPLSKKVTTLRRRLKISSPAAAAVEKFERSFPAALKAPLANSSAFSKARRMCRSDAVSDNGEILNIREILRRLEVQTESLNELKAMVKILMNERAVGKGKEKATSLKAPCSSDCKIVAFYRSPPSATPGSGRRTRRSPIPVPPVDVTALLMRKSSWLGWQLQQVEMGRIP